MGSRMAKPWKHPKSGIFWLRLRVPAELVEIAGRREEKYSLRTRDQREANALYHAEMVKLNARWRSLRLGVKSITHKEATAIAGEFYHELVAANEDDPGDRRAIIGSLLMDQVASGDPAATVIRAGDPRITDALLRGIRAQNHAAVQMYLDRRGELVDKASFDRIVAAVNGAIQQGREQVLRFADRDYRPDPMAGRFPKRAKPALKADDDHPNRYSLIHVYEQCAAETGHSASTRKRWGGIINGVAKVHPDIRTIDAEWCVRWKDELVASGKVQANTIQNVYLSALRNTCAWAVANLRIDVNPMEKVAIIGKKVLKNKEMRGYDDDEAKAVLRLTMQPEATGTAFTIAAKRWIPWICCYTGARVGEIAQLRKEDVTIEGGLIPLFWIRPEAGTVKSGKARHVAMHSHLIEMGLLDFVEKAANGPLFYDQTRARTGSTANPQYKKVGQKIAKLIRDAGFTDTQLAPNHAWRHRFKTEARDCGMDAGARDYMQGHQPATEGEGYGKFKGRTLQREIEKLPRIVLD